MLNGKDVNLRRLDPGQSGLTVQWHAGEAQVTHLAKSDPAVNPMHLQLQHAFQLCIVAHSRLFEEWRTSPVPYQLFIYGFVAKGRQGAQCNAQLNCNNVCAGTPAPVHPSTAVQIK